MPNTETQVYWDAAQEGKLLLKKCNECGRAHYQPRSHCPFCFSGNTAWTESRGTGQVYTFSIANRAQPPYVVAYVKLDEGPMMLTNIIGCEPQAVRVGQAVRVTFVPDAQGQPRPYFRLVEGE